MEYSYLDNRPIKVTVKEILNGEYTMSVSDVWFFKGEWVKSENESIFKVLTEAESSNDPFLKRYTQKFKLIEDKGDLDKLDTLYQDRDYFLKQNK